MSRPTSCFVGTWVAIALCSCSPAYPPPAGFVAACYGGDIGKKLNGAAPKLVMQIHATQLQWPELTQKFKAFGLQHQLQFFDTSVNEPGLHMLNVHLCSPSGLWLFADKRLWDNPNSKDPDPDKMPIFLFQYDGFDWKTTAKEFEKFMTDWPGKVEIQYTGSDGNQS
jgi:hypothetical protein